METARYYIDRLRELSKRGPYLNEEYYIWKSRIYLQKLLQYSILNNIIEIDNDIRRLYDENNLSKQEETIDW